MAGTIYYKNTSYSSSYQFSASGGNITVNYNETKTGSLADIIIDDSFFIDSNGFYLINTDGQEIDTGHGLDDTGGFLIDSDGNLSIDSDGEYLNDGYGVIISGSVFPVILSSDPESDSVLIGSLNGVIFDKIFISATASLTTYNLIYIGSPINPSADDVQIQLSQMQIIQQPSGKLASGNNDNFYSVYSANQFSSSYRDFKYIADVYTFSGSIAVSGSGTYITRLKTFPDPQYNTGNVNLKSIVPYLLGSDFIPVENSGSIYATASNSSINVQVVFGEDYYDTTDTFYHANTYLATSSLVTYLNSSIPFKEFQSINLDDYYLDGTGSKVLTTRKDNSINNPWKAFSNLRQWLYFYNVESPDGSCTITTYSDSYFNNVVGVYSMIQDNATVNGVQSVSIGIPQLSGLLTSAYTIVSGPSSIISSAVQSYSVQLSNITTTFYYRVTQDCGRFSNYAYKLYWLNEFGGFSSWLFSKKNLTTTQKTQSTFKKIPGNMTAGGWKTNSYSAGVQPYFTELTDTINVSSDFLTYEEVLYLKGLFSSPVIYVEDSTGTIIRATIQADSYSLNRKENQKIYALQLPLIPSVNDIRQVI